MMDWKPIGTEPLDEPILMWVREVPLPYEVTEEDGERLLSPIHHDIEAEYDEVKFWAPIEPPTGV